MSNKSTAHVATMGIDIGKNSLDVVGLDQRGAIVLRQTWSRGQIEAWLAPMPPCLIGMEACAGAHHLSRKLQALGHDARLMPGRLTLVRRNQRRQDPPCGSEMLAGGEPLTLLLRKTAQTGRIEGLDPRSRRFMPKLLGGSFWHA